MSDFDKLRAAFQELDKRALKISEALPGLSFDANHGIEWKRTPGSGWTFHLYGRPWRDCKWEELVYALPFMMLALENFAQHTSDMKRRLPEELKTFEAMLHKFDTEFP